MCHDRKLLVVEHAILLRVGPNPCVAKLVFLEPCLPFKIIVSHVLQLYVHPYFLALVANVRQCRLTNGSFRFPCMCRRPQAPWSCRSLRLVGRLRRMLGLGRPQIGGYSGASGQWRRWPRYAGSCCRRSSRPRSPAVLGFLPAVSRVSSRSPIYSMLT